MGLAREFKEFAVKGNAMDLAIGLIIGATFGKVVSSLVSDVLMPPIGLLLGNVDFARLAITLKRASVDARGNTIAPVQIRYGLFVNSVVDFIIIAFSVFLVVKALNSLRREEAQQTQ